MKTTIALFLVFTFCACGVSQQVQEKFIKIDQDLQAQCELLQIKNDSLTASFTQDSLRTQAHDIKELVAWARNNITYYRSRISELCPDLKTAGYECHQLFSLGREKDGMAYQLQRALNMFIDKINKLIEEEVFDSIAKPAFKIQEFKNDPKYKDKDFAQLNFDHTPPTAALAVLSELELEILKVQQKVLQILLQKSSVETSTEPEKDHQ